MARLPSPIFRAASAWKGDLMFLEAGSLPSSPTSLLQALLKRYEEETHAFRPDEARDLGLHAFDGRLGPVDPDARRHRLLFLEEITAALGENPVGLEARLFQHAVRSEQWRLRVERRYQSDPLFALTLIDPSCYFRGEDRPWQERLEKLVEHLQAIPDFLAELRAQLDPELPRPVLDTAIGAWEGFHGFLRKDLLSEVQQRSPGLSVGKGDGTDDIGLGPALSAARSAVREHLDFLRREALPRSRREFALGREGMEGLLREGEGLPLEVDDVVRAGEEDLRRNRRIFEEAAAEIAPGVPPGEVEDELARGSEEAADVFTQARDILDALQRFVQEHELVGLPSFSPPRVERMPPWMRWATAALDAPGPFAPAGLAPRYYLTPPEDAAASAQTGAHTRIDRSYLEVITGHEVIPGHYLHALHLREVESRPLRLFATSYHFWEGWAHYAEELLSEGGFGGARFRLMQSKAALIRDARLLCSVGLHVEGWSVEEATAFFADRAFLGEAEARREAERGTFDPQYLGYTLGKLLLQRLREDLREVQGSRFHLREFHDLVLSAGAPPISLLREEIFGLRGDRRLL